MMQLLEVVRLLDAKLEPWRFKDYAPNGLQVEGRATVRRIVTGVTASQALLDEAVRRQADAVLVHHGYFWKNEPAPLVGIKRRRIGTLLQSNMSLLAYHLPLDAHPELGNNAQLAMRLGVASAAALETEPLLWLGDLPGSVSAGVLGARLEAELGREPLLLGDTTKQIKRLAWCTGGAQGYFEQAIAQGADAFVTGEVSEQCLHLAAESGVVFIAAGHHATERYGIQALGEWLSAEHGLEVEFVDLYNPV